MIAIYKYFVRVLLIEKTIVAETLKKRIHVLQIDEQARQHLPQWGYKTIEEL